jgi:hypothetical protein
MVGDGTTGFLSALTLGALLATVLVGACALLGRRLLELLGVARTGPGGAGLAVAVGAAAAVVLVLVVSLITPLRPMGGRLVLVGLLGGAGVFWLRGRWTAAPRVGTAAARAPSRWLVPLVVVALLPWAAGALAPLSDPASLAHDLPLAFQMLNRGPEWVDPFEHQLDRPGAAAVLPALLLAASSMPGIVWLHLWMAAAAVFVLMGAARELIGERSGPVAAALALGATVVWIQVVSAGPAAAQLLFGSASWWLLGSIVRDRQASRGALAAASLVLVAWAGCDWAGLCAAVLTAAGAVVVLVVQRRWKASGWVSGAVVIGALPWVMRNALRLDHPLYGLGIAPPLRWGPGGSVQSLVAPLASLLAVGPSADPTLRDRLAATPLSLLAAPATPPDLITLGTEVLVPLVGPLLILPVALLPFALARPVDRVLVGVGLPLVATLLAAAVLGGVGTSAWPAAVPLLVLASARAVAWWRDEPIVGRALLALLVVQLVATVGVGVGRLQARAPLTPLLTGDVGVDRWRCEQARAEGRAGRCLAWSLRQRGVLKQGEGVLVIGGADPQRYPGHRVIDDHDGVPLHRFWRRWISVGGDPDRLRQGLWQEGVRLVHIDVAALAEHWRARPLALGGLDRDRMVRGGADALLRFLDSHATRLPGIEGEVALYRLQPPGDPGGQRRQSSDGDAPSGKGTRPISPRKTVGEPGEPSSTR